MYSISNYGKMITDSVRVDSYARALRQKVNSNTVVLDIGAGPGIFSLLACQFGARRVYAVEPDDSIQLAKEIALANGFYDRIEFIQDLSTRVTLPEKVDVIVSDISGVLPFFKYHIPSIIDARKRFLVSGGSLIPLRNTLWAAIIETANLYEDHMAPWIDGCYGLDLSAGRSLVANTWRKFKASPDQLLTKPQYWGEIDYSTVGNPDIFASVNWTATRAGTGHGIVAWVDASVADDIGFSNAPGQPETIYGNAFFPWTAPVELCAGDTVALTLRADLIGEEYVWQWNTRVISGTDPGQLKANFRQSTFFATPLSLSRLHRKAANHVAALNEDGEIDKFILQQMNGENTLEQIARDLMQQFPARFTDFTAALTAAGDRSLKYS